MGTAVWLAFFVSMLAAGFTGLSYASLGSRYPRAGGAAYATHRAFNSGFLSYVVGLAILASGLTSMATAARVFAGYFSGVIWSGPIPVIAVVFTLAVAVVVLIGIKESLFANGLFTLIEVGGLLLVLTVGASYVGSVNYFDFSVPSNPDGEFRISQILTGGVLTFYSFVGFEDMLNIAEEVKEPRKTMPRGLLLAVLISSLIYMGISVVAVSVLSPADLASSERPLVDVVAKAAPWFPTPLFGVIAMFAVANTALLNFIMSSRLLLGMGRHHLVPKPMSYLHPTRKSPDLAIAVVWILFVILVLSGDISSLAKATSVLLLSCFIVVNLALLVLKRREKIEGTFDVPDFVPVLGALICGSLLLKARASELFTAGTIIALIVALYFILRPKARDIEHMDEA
jgi:amino acid transporter